MKNYEIFHPNLCMPLHFTIHSVVPQFVRKSLTFTNKESTWVEEIFPFCIERVMWFAITRQEQSNRFRFVDTFFSFYYKFHFLKSTTQLNKKSIENSNKELSINHMTELETEKVKNLVLCSIFTVANSKNMFVDIKSHFIHVENITKTPNSFHILVEIFPIFFFLHDIEAFQFGILRIFVDLTKLFRFNNFSFSEKSLKFFFVRNHPSAHVWLATRTQRKKRKVISITQMPQARAKRRGKFARQHFLRSTDTIWGWSWTFLPFWIFFLRFRDSKSPWFRPLSCRPQFEASEVLFTANKCSPKTQ